MNTPTTVPQPTELSRPCEIKFGKLALKCVSCTPTEAADGFILKLVHSSSKQMKTPFGLKVTPIKHTFYMKVSEECVVGFEAEQDLDLFNIVERPFDVADTDTGEVITIWCKWLHIM